MFRGRIFTFIVFALLILGTLSLGGYAGWSQGYEVGRLAAGGEGGAVAPYGPYGVGFFPFFWGIGLIFRLGFFLLFILFVARFFRFWGWGMAGGPPGGRWGSDRHHRARPGWNEDQDDAKIRRHQSVSNPPRKD